MAWKMFFVTFVYGSPFELYIWWTFAQEFYSIALCFPKLQGKIWWKVEVSRPGKLFYGSFSPRPATWFDKHKQSKLHNLPVGVNLPKIWLWAGYFLKVSKNVKIREKKPEHFEGYLQKCFLEHFTYIFKNSNETSSTKKMVHSGLSGQNW